jgi:hypothetical protein
VDGKAVVTIGGVDQTFVGGIDAAFFVGCQNPTGCNPPRFGYSNPAPSCGTTSTGCAGNLDFDTVLGQNSRAFQLSRSCSQARWVFKESADPPNFFSAPRDSSSSYAAETGCCVWELCEKVYM